MDNKVPDAHMSRARRPYVVYWNNIPSPYMVDRFNALADRGEFDFEAWFNDRIAPDRSWNIDESSWRFVYRYLPVIHLGHWTLHLPLLGRRPDVLVSLYAEPSFIFGWMIAWLRRIKTGFWVEVTFDRWIKRTWFKQFIKKWMFRHVDTIVTVAEDGRKFAIRNGADPDRVFFAPHVIDVEHFRNSSARARLQRAALRAEIGLHGVTFIYVGRLIKLKGIDYLIDAYARVVQQTAEQISLLLVGDGVEQARLQEICEKKRLCNAVFVGFQQKEDLPRYYAVADVFVFPTLGDTYGLVVDEAMACSLPVVSTSAVGEIRSRIEDGVNGYIVPPEDSAALTDRMLYLAQHGEIRESFGKAAALKIAGHTPERWSEDFEKIVKALLQSSCVQ